MLITTKNGRDSEKMTVNVRAELGVSAPTRIPKIADGVTFMETYNEACATRGENPRYSREKIMGTKLGLDPLRLSQRRLVRHAFQKQHLQPELQLQHDGRG